MRLAPKLTPIILVCGGFKGWDVIIPLAAFSKYVSTSRDPPPDLLHTYMSVAGLSLLSDKQVPTLPLNTELNSVF